MILLILYGSRLITLNQFMSLKIRFSMCITKISKIYQDKLNDVGIMAYPLKYMSPKLCGLGDVDWGKYVSALTDIGYQGYSVIEVEDKALKAVLIMLKSSEAVSKIFKKFRWLISSRTERRIKWIRIMQVLKNECRFDWCRIYG